MFPTPSLRELGRGCIQNYILSINSTIGKSARARWLRVFFSSSVISAMVFPSSGMKKTGS